MATEQIRTDRALVEACLRGDSRAWDALRTRVIRVCRRALADRPDLAGATAGDLAGEVMPRLLADDCARLRSYEGRSCLDAWLAPIVRNTVVDLLRFSQTWRMAAVIDEEELIAKPYPGPDVETLAVARATLAALPEWAREIIELRELEGLSYEGIAQRLHITPAAARQRHHRALELIHGRQSGSPGHEGPVIPPTPNE